MSDREPLQKAIQIDPTQLQEYRDFYVDLLGFVPPRIQARTDMLARVDPELLAMQEDMRRHAMYPKAFDVKTSQLIPLSGCCWSSLPTRRGCTRSRRGALARPGKS